MRYQLKPELAALPRPFGMKFGKEVFQRIPGSLYVKLWKTDLPQSKDYQTLASQNQAGVWDVSGEFLELKFPEPFGNAGEQGHLYWGTGFRYAPRKTDLKTPGI